MKKWSKKELLDKGYNIDNCIITYADLKVEYDTDSIVLCITVKGEDGICNLFRSYRLGSMVKDKDPETFDSDKRSMLAIMNILYTVGVESLSELVGKYIRVVYDGGIFIGIIGNIISNRWFDFESFWHDEPSEEDDDEEEE